MGDHAMESDNESRESAGASRAERLDDLVWAAASDGWDTSELAGAIEALTEGGPLTEDEFRVLRDAVASYYGNDDPGYAYALVDEAGVASGQGDDAEGPSNSTALLSQAPAPREGPDHTFNLTTGIATEANQATETAISAHVKVIGDWVGVASAINDLAAFFEKDGANWSNGVSLVVDVLGFVPGFSWAGLLYTGTQIIVGGLEDLAESARQLQIGPVVDLRRWQVVEQLAAAGDAQCARLQAIQLELTQLMDSGAAAHNADREAAGLPQDAYQMPAVNLQVDAMHTCRDVEQQRIRRQGPPGGMSHREWIESGRAEVEATIPETCPAPSDLRARLETENELLSRRISEANEIEARLAAIREERRAREEDEAAAAAYNEDDTYR